MTGNYIKNFGMAVTDFDKLDGGYHCKISIEQSEDIWEIIDVVIPQKLFYCPLNIKGKPMAFTGIIIDVQGKTYVLADTLSVLVSDLNIIKNKLTSWTMTGS